MAVSIDTVYQRVLSVANKEQRGYVTPQEFNLFANQAQMDIFEQYFYDINQFGRIKGNNTEYSDMLNILHEKISAFEKFKIAVSMSSNTGTLAADLYRLGTVFYTGTTPQVIIERVSKQDLQYIQNSPLTSPTEKRPIYVYEAPSSTGVSKIKCFPSTAITANVAHNYIAKPANVSWNYTEINGVAMYNSTNSTDFELHESEETELVFKILQLAGVSIESMDLYQVAAQEEIRNIQQEKQ